MRSLHAVSDVWIDSAARLDLGDGLAVSQGVSAPGGLAELSAARCAGLHGDRDLPRNPDCGRSGIGARR